MKLSTNLGDCIHSRRDRRVLLNCAAILTESDGFTVDVMIVDVSKDGFRLRSVTELELGSRVSLQMDNVAPVRCEIRWSCGHEAGGIFLDPITI
ncbi:MAG: PilZ domain-containing protein [Sphingomicrobium sp.]